MKTSLVWPLIVFACAAAPNHATQEVERTQLLLGARDQALDAYYVPFVARHEQSGTAWEVVGWCARKGLDRAMAQVDRGRQPQEFEKEVWNGVQLKNLRSLADLVQLDAASNPALGDQSDKSTVCIIGSRFTGALASRAYLPQNFGLEAAGRSVASFLEPAARPLGTAEVNGRRCEGYLVDGAPAGGDGTSLSAPREIWLDLEQSLLAIRTISYVRLDSKARQEVEPSKIQQYSKAIDGETWLRFQVWDTTAVFECAPGLFFPRRGVYTTPVINDLEVVVTVDSDSALFASHVPVRCFALEYGKGTLVENNTIGTHFVEGQPATDEEAFAQLLREGLGGILAGKVEAQSFAGSSCGPNALLLVALSEGAAVNLPTLIGLIPPEQREDGKTNLSALRKAAEAIGLHAAAVTVGPDFLLEWNKPLLVQLTQDDGHFAVARAMQDGRFVELLSPPRERNVVPLELLAQRWTGNALLISRDELPLSGAVRWGRLAIGCSLIFLGLSLFWKRRVGARQQ